MRYVGIDLHKRSLTVCVIDKRTGETFDRRFQCSEEAALRKFFGELGPFEAVIEASGTYEWLWELLEPLAKRLVLAHPKKLRIIAESMKKTDRHDAYLLAWLLSQDAIPEAHRPTPHQREYQLLVKHRHFLVQSRTKCRNQLRSLLAARNLDYTGLFSAKGKARLASLALKPAERFRVEQLLKLHETLEEQVKTAAKELSKFRKEAPEAEKKQHAIVTSVPGVGNVTADVVLSTLGDVSRFGSQQKVTAYSGLVPGFRESASKRRELGITKQGPRLLRWVLVEAAWQATRYSGHWREVFERIAERRGRKKAIVAVARKLLAVIYSLLKKGESYVEKLVIPKRRLRVSAAGIMKT